MQIRDILKVKGTEVVTIGPGQTIHDAINKLNEHGIGALVVTDEGAEIVGIITERDVLRVCGSNYANLYEPTTQKEPDYPALVQDAMTKELIIGIPGDDINYVMGIMSKNHIRHLPVLDNGSLKGIISIGDLVNARLEEKVFENRTLRSYIQGAVC
jgi:CBS domain-containing protein